MRHDEAVCSAEDARPGRPRLLFFRYAHDKRAPRFLTTHGDEFERCLSQHFDVQAVTGRGDYRRLCDQHQPRLVVFEVGLQLQGSHRPVLCNLGAHPGIPRIGLLNADAWGSTVGNALAEFEALRLEALFTICTTTGEHLPALHGRLFYQPNFIDPAIFHPYDVPKAMPVLLTGRRDQQYPWRLAISKRLARRYQAAQLPHTGYDPGHAAKRMLSGEPYARALASAWFAPACGTVVGELVRKHLEIPACGTCLIAERTPALLHAGFIDMDNCVFAEPADVVEKIEHLLARKDALRQMISRATTLVMSRHTIAHRDQIRQWFDLRSRQQPGQHIIQPGPFERLTLDATKPASTFATRPHGRHLDLLAQGDRMLEQRGQAALDCYNQALGFIPSMPQARLRAALAEMLLGRPRAALARIVDLNKQTLAGDAEVTPDPLEWALLIVCLLCLGKLRQAARRIARFGDLGDATLSHLGRLLKEPTHVAYECREPRLSIHWPPSGRYDAWMRMIRAALEAAGRPELSRALLEATPVLSGRPWLHPPLIDRRPLRGFDNPLWSAALYERWRRWRVRAAVDQPVSIPAPERTA
jgi:hypothetical protein